VCQIRSKSITYRELLGCTLGLLSTQVQIQTIDATIHGIGWLIFILVILLVSLGLWSGDSTFLLSSQMYHLLCLSRISVVRVNV
jgi:uncharacterized membrane protein YjdF